MEYLQRVVTATIFAIMLPVFLIACVSKTMHFKFQDLERVENRELGNSDVRG